MIPRPAEMTLSPTDRFVVSAATTVYVPAGNERVRRIGQYLADLIGTAAAPDPPRVEEAREPLLPGSIHLALGDLPATGEEGYELTISPERVAIVANTPAGLFYGVQSLRQLLPAAVEYEAARPNKERPIWVPAGRIVDRPRFGWRGAMLDVSRHFLGVEDVKRYLDLMALYKLNRLHLHLSDDQGWRIEIKSWPNLTTIGGRTEVGGGPGGYYTQEQYADLVAYAQERFVTIVPEIDMPGHTNAALASYPELNCDGVAPPPYTGTEVGFSALCVGKAVTYAFIDDVVRELAAMTPGTYLHVGGDEVKTLDAEDYASFIERVQDIVRSRGKVMVGWDEVAAARLHPSTIVQHWRPKESPATAVRQGAAVILSPAHKAYLDMKYDRDTVLGLSWAGYVSVSEAYGWDPVTLFEDVPESAVLGVEAPLWSETLGNIRDFEYMAFPRLAAIAEVGWSAAAGRTWDEFRQRLGAQAPRWTALGVNFHRAPEVEWR